MINLYFNFYFSEDEKRNSEILFCLDKNLRSKIFDKVYLIISEQDLSMFDKKNELLEIFIFDKRPTFEDYVNIIGSTCDENDINIFLNSDCYVCDTSADNILKIRDGEMWCLQKYNIIDDKLNFEFENIDCSQDVWIFRGKPKKIENVDFYFGVPGCDNRFAFECERAGYSISNPCLDLKFFHYHLSQIRTCPYDQWEIHRIPRPYKMIQPSNIK